MKGLAWALLEDKSRVRARVRARARVSGQGRVEYGVRAGFSN